ncbi:MAG: phosphate signaling complex protein PhoU [Clostridia bacterium]|jgi:phosphate transport system protein|nr:phosphate signaling complex protein PhoU [Clostridia bacterium]
MRVHFDEQLKLLNRELITMGALCEDAISASIRALFENNDESADKASEAEEQIDRKERDIESLCMRLLLQQQPVACDLRVISSALKMISDMERIGDQASDIAEITRVINKSNIKSSTHLHDMSDAAIHMVTESISSFVKKDLDLARDVQKYDDIVDNKFDQVKNELISIISGNPESGEVCLDILMIAKYLERIGDHAVNVAEWVEYSITGQHRKRILNEVEK